VHVPAGTKALKFGMRLLSPSASSPTSTVRVVAQRGAKADGQKFELNLRNDDDDVAYDRIPLGDDARGGEERGGTEEEGHGLLAFMRPEAKTRGGVVKLRLSLRPGARQAPAHPLHFLFGVGPPPVDYQLWLVQVCAWNVCVCVCVIYIYI
jgi:hypothetical protein